MISNFSSLKIIIINFVNILQRRMTKFRFGIEHEHHSGRLTTFFCRYFLNLTWVDHSEYNTVLPWFPVWNVQTVTRYPDRNWLPGLCHPLHLPHKSDAVMEQATMETTFGALPGIEPGTLHTRVKDLNTVPHCSSKYTKNIQQHTIAAITFCCIHEQNFFFFQIM